MFCFLKDVLSLINVEELLNDFNWREAGNAAALEERLLNELAALEAVCRKVNYDPTFG